MEPADNRREHQNSSGYPVSYGNLPQWSPPMIGGNTAATMPQMNAMTAPQWSPPMIGGNTGVLADQ